MHFAEAVRLLGCITVQKEPIPENLAVLFSMQVLRRGRYV